MMFNSPVTEAPQEGETRKDFKGSAKSAILGAEKALAQAMMEVSEAVVNGDVEPCACHYVHIANAQEHLERLDHGLTNHDSKDDQESAAERLVDMLARIGRRTQPL